MRRTLVAVAAAGTTALLGLASVAPAVAAGGDVVVTDRETVQAYLTPTGTVKVARLYDQVTATGNGTVEIANPVSTDGLRNLDGLGSPKVRDGKAVTTLSVSGEERLRTVSTFDKDDLPVTVTPTYTLDGKEYEDPEDVVGRSGELTVSFRVENVTSEPTTLTVKDGKGNDVQRQVDVPLPLVGSLTTVLPKGFYSVRSDQATMSADGRGGTRMTFTMTLLPPIGTPVAEFGYTAQVSDAVIPKAVVSVAVVQPLKYPSLKTAAESYAGGSETGSTLTAGAEEIDSNLLKLRDGAGQLLGGLIQLRDGAQQLNAGLAGEAAPGAHQLADGAGQAAAGASELATGLGKIAKGNKDLAAGFNSPTGDTDLVSGSQDLASGLGLISGGLSQLAGVEGLPQAQASTLALRAGVDKILAGLGSATTAGTILNGLAQLSAGTTALSSGVTSLRAGADQLASTTAGLPAAKGGVDQVRAGMASSLATGGSIDQLKGGLTAAFAFGACAGAVSDALTAPPASDCDYIRAVYAGIEGANGLRAKTTAAEVGLGQVSTGLGSAIAGVGTGSTPGATTLRGGLAQVAGGLSQSAAGLTQITAGVSAVKLGLSNPACNTAKPTDPANPCGVREGLTLLSNGLLTAVSGISQLSAGAGTAADGAGDLAAGIAKAGDGAQQLADGSATAAAGSRELADGNGKIAAGAGDLAVGLDKAAGGSGQLADGLEQAADGAPALVDGAQRLSDEGTKKLVEAGNDTTVEFGEKYAVLEAMAERTADGGLPFGAPEGATGSAAYSLELAAATNEGSKNLTRGVLALGALGVGALLSQLVRSRVA